MTNPTQTIPGLTAATALGGTEQLWINQNGTDLRTTTQDVADLAISSLPTIQNIFIGLGENISSLHLLPYTILGQTNFYTTGFYTTGDGGGAQYYHNTGSSQPGDQVTADGVRLSLSLSQQLTWEMLGAPATGAICTATISGTTMTTSAIQNGTIAIGQTVTAIGGTGGIAAGTIITDGSGTSWTVNISQTVGSTVVCMNDSYPYFAAAQTLGIHGMLIGGTHYFSQSILVNGSAVYWYGPNGRQATGYLAILNFPSGYGGLFVGPPNMTINAQGDVSYTGNFQNGGGAGSTFDRLMIRIGSGARPASVTNNRPVLGVYTQIHTTALTVQGADGNGITINGDTTHTLSDASYFYDTFCQSVAGNGIEAFGADANANRFYGVFTNDTGLSGVYDHSFLGNSYIGGELQVSGRNATTVRRSNNLYDSIQDGNTNHDPLSSPTWWQLRSAEAGADTWNSGTTYNVGAAYRTAGGNNRSEFIGIYVEGGFPPPLLQAAVAGRSITGVFGGLVGSGFDLTNGNYYGGNDGSNRAYSVTALSASGGFLATSNGGPESVGLIVTNTASNPAGLQFVSGGTTNVGFIRGSIFGAGSLLKLSTYSSGTRTDMLTLDGPDSTVAPSTDNTFSLGVSTNRWTDVRSIKINGSLPGIKTKGDTAATLTVGTDNQTVIWNTILTADRAVTLSTTGAINGSKFRVVRNASATGAFNLNVGTGPLKALGTAGTWVDVEYDGSAWVETASGSL